MVQTNPDKRTHIHQSAVVTTMSRSHKEGLTKMTFNSMNARYGKQVLAHLYHVLVFASYRFDRKTKFCTGSISKH